MLCARFLVIGAVCVLASASAVADEKRISADEVRTAMRHATEFMTSKVAVNGGYVYQVSEDLTQRFGEGKATATEVWVQPPGTPTAGLAYLRAWQATQDDVHLQAARACAAALMYGQLESGGWADRIDFDPNGRNADRYRNGRGRAKGRNYSTLDDDKTQAALRFLIELDRELKFEDAALHDAVQYALESLLSAQFVSGGFPQGWSRPVEPGVAVKASFPEYDWKTEGRFKNYWDFPTLNDGLAGTVTETLELAYQTYQDARYRAAMLRFGDFLILAQMPEPQPAWAQQYNHQMKPIWARKFEPPAVVGSESQDVIETLLFLHRTTGETRFLEPIPAALAWLKKSQLPDGQVARFYELKSNRPLYFVKDTYELTYSDNNLPTHYGFKGRSKVDRLEKDYESQLRGDAPKGRKPNVKSLTRDAARILAELDDSGRWLKNGKIESSVFAVNMTNLAEYLQATQP
ncbi:MAG: pectate lyase [Planctomycetota bacterium]